MKRPTLTTAAVTAAIPGTYGQIVNLAKKLGVTYRTIRKWLDSHEEIEADLNAERLKLRAAAESKLWINVDSGDQRAIEYALDHIAPNGAWIGPKRVDVTTGGEQMSMPKSVIFSVIPGNPDEEPVFEGEEPDTVE